MRLWTLHPKYLDAQGLVALWREALLAREVLRGRTRGYRRHPQLERFRLCATPRSAINRYLAVVCREALSRGYRFDLFENLAAMPPSNAFPRPTASCNTNGIGCSKSCCVEALSSIVATLKFRCLRCTLFLRWSPGPLRSGSVCKSKLRANLSPDASPGGADAPVRPAPVSFVR